MNFGLLARFGGVEPSGLEGAAEENGGMGLTVSPTVIIVVSVGYTTIVTMGIIIGLLLWLLLFYSLLRL